MRDIKEEAKGRWYGILSAMGINVGVNGKHTACPVCGGKDRFRFDDREGSGSWICNQCGAGNGIDLIMRVLKCDFREAVTEIKKVIGTADVSKPQPEAQISKETLRQIYTESRPISTGDAVDLYLRGRGLNIRSNKLRFHPNCYEPETKTNMPAMLAIYQLADSTAITMHRTFVTQNGNKANLEDPKKVLPALQSMCGGAIRLQPPRDGLIGITEGIETALAVTQLTQIPCWSAVSSALLEKFEPPKGIKYVMIFADRDKNFTGQKAAYILANKLVIKYKIFTEVHLPKCEGDFVDELSKKEFEFEIDT